MNSPLPYQGGNPAPAAVPTTPVENDDDRQDEQGTALSTFCQYQPSALPLHLLETCFPAMKNERLKSTVVPSHTSPACESNLLSSVPAPTLHDTDALAATLLPLFAQEQQTDKPAPALSPLQLEGVLLALQRHRRIFRNGERAGFFLGDGAGIGKGEKGEQKKKHSNRCPMHVALCLSSTSVCPL